MIDNKTIYGRESPNGTRFFKTFDGGTTWDSIGIPTTCAFSFINKDTGWLTGTSGIYKTTNGGASLQLISTENSCCTQLQMLKNPYNGEYYGWSVRAFSKGIYKTTNGGINWVIINELGPDNINLFFLNKDTGWISKGSFLAFTTNNGVNWVGQPINSAASGDIYFTNVNKGWVGGIGFRVFATSNGGQVWGTQSAPQFTTGQIFFIDSLTGWCGTNQLAKTTNGGGNITSIEYEPIVNIPINIELKQNYPNPFNPETTVEFVLNENSSTSFKVFNILGKEILSVYNNNILNKGKYKIKIDFGTLNLSSGVYFYSLQTNNFNKTMKMIYNK